jgi:hypothetical protein
MTVGNNPQIYDKLIETSMTEVDETNGKYEF